jgi:hypothetical protein
MWKKETDESMKNSVTFIFVVVVYNKFSWILLQSCVVTHLLSLHYIPVRLNLLIFHCNIILKFNQLKKLESSSDVKVKEIFSTFFRVVYIFLQTMKACNNVVRVNLDWIGKIWIIISSNLVVFPTFVIFICV